MWEISISGQVYSCIYSLILGAILCFIYDIIRITRKAGADSFAEVFIGDILFWLVSAVLVFIFLVSVTNGEIRGYIIFFCALGFFIYRFTVGKLLFGIVLRLVLFLSKLWRRFSNLLKFIGMSLETGADKIFGKIRGLTSSLFTHLKKLLKSAYNMLYTKKRKAETEYDVNE